MSKNILLISSNTIKETTGVHTNIDDKMIAPVIKVAQDLDLHPLLGTALFRKIQDLIEDSTLTTGVYKTLVDDYITDALCWFTVCRLPMQLSYQFWNKGVLRKQAENTETPSMSDLVSIANDYKNIAESYGQRIVKYLIQNSISYPEYINPGSGVDTIYPDRGAFTMPVYLDDSCGCKKSYEEKYQGNNPRC